jgi:hypothetical protein
MAERPIRLAPPGIGMSGMAADLSNAGLNHRQGCIIENPA